MAPSVTIHRRRGSSPLTRGAHLNMQVWGHTAGLIPAHAGSTRWWIFRFPGVRAHPRSRGEHEAAPVAGFHFSGSSPLTRGAPHHDDASGLVLGLIPAHAGSTRSQCALLIASRAHPRSRGEHNTLYFMQCRDIGSSPLTRGAPFQDTPIRAGEGLIPAHAGSTCLRSGVHSGRGAHPRSRGEHTC